MTEPDLIGAAADAILVLDERGGVVRLNAAAERLFGGAGASLPGLTGEPQQLLPARRADGSEFPAEVSLGAAGALRIAIVRDVSAQMRDRAALQEALRQAGLANQAKSDFLANVSHELRTPLNAIIGFTEIMRDGMFGAVGVPRYRAYLDDIHDSAVHLLEMINDILDVARVEGGHAVLREEALDLAAVAAACERLVATRARKRRQSIELGVPADLPRLLADARALKQIVLNLLSNAVKFTPEGGRIAVDAAIAGDGALALRIADNGIGMAAGDIPKALARFGQIEAAQSRSHDGVGLGLPLVKALAEMHGGAIAIDSALGRGTTVTVLFPPRRVLPRSAGQ